MVIEDFDENLHIENILHAMTSLSLCLCKYDSETEVKVAEQAHQLWLSDLEANNASSTLKY